MGRRSFLGGGRRGRRLGVVSRGTSRPPEERRKRKRFDIVVSIFVQPSDGELRKSASGLLRRHRPKHPPPILAPKTLTFRRPSHIHHVTTPQLNLPNAAISTSSSSSSRGGTHLTGRRRRTVRIRHPSSPSLQPPHPDGHPPSRVDLSLLPVLSSCPSSSSSSSAGEHPACRRKCDG
jgi:hypothetical protein